MARRPSDLVNQPPDATLVGVRDNGTVSIDELVVVCERMAATNRALFERLGAWVSDEPDARRQQWFSVACHRHAWHAELWEERRPKVPLDAAPTDAGADHQPANRGAWYADRLSSLRRELVALEPRVDPVLDPSTRRVITLVAADLADLATTSPSAQRPSAAT